MVSTPEKTNTRWSFNHFATTTNETTTHFCQTDIFEKELPNQTPASNDIADGNSDFVNPSEEYPVQIEDFLHHLDLTPILPTLQQLYGEDYRFKFPMDAMLKTLIYFKLKPYNFLTELWSDLVASPHLADALGFKNIPDYNTLYHFLIKRLNSKGMKLLLDAFVEANRRELEKHGITLGEEIIQDVSPLPAKKKDKEADWNGHYELWCYLWHNLRCMHTGLPLNFHITNGREDEAHFLAPFILKLTTLQQIHPIRVYIDGGYTGFENIARMYVFFNIDVVCNIDKDWKYSDLGTEAEIQRRYNKLWKQPYYQPHADFNYIQYAMMMSDEPRFKQIGMYHRNNILARYEECPDGYLDHYHFRNRIENNHGTEKRKTEITHIEAKGIERTTTHIGMHILALHAIALCRLQHGITTGLTNLAGLI
ncbi:MAG: transposase [Candidatus Thermoplasmatota archaeon]